jgi:acyl carrier protein
MRETLKSLLAEVLGRGVEEIPDDAQASSLEGWDSLRHLELMLMLEAQFGVHISTESMIELVSLEQIEGYLGEHAPDHAR